MQSSLKPPPSYLEAISTPHLNYVNPHNEVEQAPPYNNTSNSEIENFQHEGTSIKKQPIKILKEIKSGNIFKDFEFADTDTGKTYSIATFFFDVELISSTQEPLMKMNYMGSCNDIEFWKLTYLKKIPDTYLDVRLTSNPFKKDYKFLLRMVKPDGERIKYTLTYSKSFSSNLILTRYKSSEVILEYATYPFKKNKVKIYSMIDENDLNIFLMTITLTVCDYIGRERGLL